MSCIVSRNKENGKAYPDFLIRYYCGKRDPDRTPYENEEDTTKSTHEQILGTIVRTNTSLPNSKKTEETSLDVEIGSIPSASGVTWEYRFSKSWRPYSKPHQLSLENAYQQHLIHPGDHGNNKVYINTTDWKYEVDLQSMIQTNIQHKNRKQRRVRRNDSSK